MDNSTQVLTRNNVNISGKGDRTIVFAHGFGCDQNMWRFVAPHFEEEYKVVLFDYVGSGKSDLRAYSMERYGSLDGYAEDILEIGEALGLSDALFVGHSVGATIGLLASIKTPALFSRLILLGPSPCYLNDPPDYLGGLERADVMGLLEMMDRNYVGWANFLAPHIMQNADRPELGKELTESFCSTDPVIARHFAEVTFLSDHRDELQSVSVPSLIMQCSQDFIAPESVGHYLAQNLRDSVLYQMEATGHCPHVSHPDETAETIKKYLETC